MLTETNGLKILFSVGRPLTLYPVISGEAFGSVRLIVRWCDTVAVDVALPVYDDFTEIYLRSMGYRFTI